MHEPVLLASHHALTAAACCSHARLSRTLWRMNAMLRWTWVVAIAAASCCAVTACEPEKDAPLPAIAPGEKAFDVNARSSSEPDLIIRRIVLAPAETRIYLQFRNPSGKHTHEISTAPPGKAETFFLEAGDHQRHVQLTRSSGIAVSPAKQTVPRRSKVDFVLYFPAIDETWSPMDLHEGEVLKSGTIFWNFTKVALK
jgi:hypothetical protein